MKNNTKAIISNNIEVDLTKILSETQYDSIFILMDNNTRKYCYEHISNIAALQNTKTISIKEGEDNKNIETIMYIWNLLDTLGAKRNSLLINLGGGMLSDLGGFAASCYKRGIDFINIPTTLLAQVDASAGGKTGFNFNSYKNQIGVFSLPKAVIISPIFLKTLSKKDFISGYGEMLKHALINEEKYLEDLLTFDTENIDYEKLATLISTSVDIKNQFVEQDPEEQNIRKALNFGHTIGHAIESYAIKNNLNIFHGEAVALGMIAELYLSVKKKGFPEEKFNSISERIKKIYPSFDTTDRKEELVEIMMHDKKNTDSKINFTLLKDVGEFEIDNYCEKDEIIEALNSL